LPNFGKAVVEPNAVAARVDFDDRVQHWFSTARRSKTSEIEPRAWP
jgi:hypothetical protein